LGMKGVSADYKNRNSECAESRMSGIRQWLAWTNLDRIGRPHATAPGARADLAEITPRPASPRSRRRSLVPPHRGERRRRRGRALPPGGPERALSWRALRHGCSKGSRTMSCASIGLQDHNMRRGCSVRPGSLLSACLRRLRGKLDQHALRMRCGPPNTAWRWRA
jgi:hypothetical protein